MVIEPLLHQEASALLAQQLAQAFLLAQQLAQAFNVEALSVHVLVDVAVEGFETKTPSPHVDQSR